MEYCDDGYTGKNFERPGFKKMMEAAQDGAIQCILVKDLSRFGRDYIIVGNYISKVLPFLGVRLISVKDLFDSARKSDVDSLNVCFQTLIYDLYSRDLSQKVKSAKRQLVERGVYINPIAPFGYRKDPGDKHRLLIDPAPAETVHHIFDMAAQGASTREIARWLNTHQTPTLSRQKRGTSGEHANWSADNFWTQKMVSGLIRDRQYAGNLVWGKRVRNQIGVHQQLTTRVEDRVVVDDCHEAIVSMELYHQAQAALGGEYRPNRAHVGRNYPLRGKIHCGVCGYAITRTAYKHAYYCCGTPITLPGAKCAQERVYECDLVDVIITAIQTQASYAMEAERILATQREREAALVRSEQAELEQTGTQRGYLAEQMQRLYEKLVDGAMTREIYRREKSALLRRLEEINKKSKTLKQKIAERQGRNNPFIKAFRKYAGLESLTAEVVAELVDRVTIRSDGMLDIRLNYADELQSFLARSCEQAV